MSKTGANITKAKTVPFALNQCMYCGNVAPPLTDEHILPRGLNGELILRRSCCTACQKMIGAVETSVLKSGWLSDPRLVMGLRSYKPKKQSTSVKMTFVGLDGMHFDKTVPKEDAVALMTMPELIPPRYLTHTVLEAKDGMEVCATNNAVVYRGVIEQIGTSHSERVAKALQRLCMKYGARTVELSARVLPPQFIRFLCKIAYGLYVSERGMFPLEDSPALAILKAERTDYSNWVGSRPISVEDRASSLHRMSIEDITSGQGAGCQVVNISLFNQFGPTFQYTVIVRALGWKERFDSTQAPTHLLNSSALKM